MRAGRRAAQRWAGSAQVAARAFNSRGAGCKATNLSFWLVAHAMPAHCSNTFKRHVRIVAGSSRVAYYTPGAAQTPCHATRAQRDSLVRARSNRSNRSHTAAGMKGTREIGRGLRRPLPPRWQGQRTLLRDGIRHEIRAPELAREHRRTLRPAHVTPPGGHMPSKAAAQQGTQAHGDALRQLQGQQCQ